MNLSVLDLGLWIAGLLGDAALFAILFIRRRYRDFPAFTAYICFQFALNLLLFWLFLHGLWSGYRRAYWTYVLLDFLLQLAVIWEIARIVLRPTGSWVLDAKNQFILWSAVGLLFAAALPWLITPPDAGVLPRLEVRGNLFTSLLICELIAVVTRTSRSLGLGWRNHVMALGNGWTLWAVVAILVDGLHSYFGAEHFFRGLEHIRMFAYLSVLGYWSLQFWLNEPARRPISPELNAYIQALHLRIKNNLDRLGEQR
jgi:hypothetical protein